MGGESGSRRLEWEGCVNVSDLGGLTTLDGRVTRHRAIVRSDAPSRLTESGWRALQAYGIRTIVDLRNDDERAPDLSPRPASVETTHVPLDGIEDTNFWEQWTSGPQFGTPLYYPAFLERFPERAASALGAVADARPAAWPSVKASPKRSTRSYLHETRPGASSSWS